MDKEKFKIALESLEKITDMKKINDEANRKFEKITKTADKLVQKLKNVEEMANELDNSLNELCPGRGIKLEMNFDFIKN